LSDAVITAYSVERLVVEFVEGLESMRAIVGRGYGSSLWSESGLISCTIVIAALLYGCRPISMERRHALVGFVREVAISGCLH
jgi:hypothetical protein